jgi:hypothetical protein
LADQKNAKAALELLDGADKEFGRLGFASRRVKVEQVSQRLAKQ